jgi:hypothetical protein
MRAYSAVAVAESLQFMNDNGTPRRPVVGPLTTFSMRTALRLTDRVPALRRRMARNLQRVRDAELDPA